MNAKPVLKLMLKQEWFEMIVRGKKTTDYREIKKYYRNIFPNTLYDNKQMIKINGVLYKPYEVNVLFRNGYSKSAPTLLIECEHVDIGFGKTEWGAIEGVKYYRIYLGKIIELNGKLRPPRMPVSKHAFQARVRRAGTSGTIKTIIIPATGVKKATEYLLERNYDIFTEPFLIKSKSKSRMNIDFQI